MRRTSFANALQEPLTEILSDVRRLVQAGQAFDPLTSRRSFTIVASDYVAVVLLRSLLSRLTVIAPTIGVRVAPVDGQLMENVRRGYVDLAIYPSELLPTDRYFHAEPLFVDDFVCVTDAANDAVGDTLTTEQLSTLPYLAILQGLLPSLADQRLDDARIARNVTMVAQSFVMAPFMLPGTRMYTMVQRKLAATLMPEGQFKLSSLPFSSASSMN